jgi:single-strand DNA-binding protein
MTRTWRYIVAIKTSPSINGFIASDPRPTFNDDGEARLYARIGIQHYRREEDRSFTELEPTFHDLVQFGKGAELSAERFRKRRQLPRPRLRARLHTRR